MASKFVAIFALVAVASAQHYQNDHYHQQPQYAQYQAPAQVHYQAPALIKSYQPAVVKQLVQPTLVKQVHHEEPANYEFNYDVHDPQTQDVKQQHETAKDGAISGQYSLIDADGYRRIVDYTADDHHGFQANVRREPVEGHKIVKVAQPAIAVQKYIAQPAVAVHKYAAAPAVHYSAPAPAVHYSAPAPAVHYSAPAPAIHYSAPAPQYYSAPAPVKVAVAQPIVQKYISQPAVAVHKYAAAPQYAQQHGTPYTHVSFSGPSSNYHY